MPDNLVAVAIDIDEFNDKMETIKSKMRDISSKYSTNASADKETYMYFANISTTIAHGLYPHAAEFTSNKDNLPLIWDFISTPTFQLALTYYANALVDMTAQAMDFMRMGATLADLT
eukprot:Nk52_evm1s1732 gene=Nk52_evmTU1s1732